jgi:hypothetical protein
MEAHLCASTVDMGEVVRGFFHSATAMRGLVDHMIK